MANVSFTHENVPPPIDRALEAVGAIADQAQKPLRCRVNPDLYDHARTTYTSWTGLSWVIELRDVEEGRRLREGLTAFMEVFGRDMKAQRRLIAELAKLAGDR